MKATYQITAKQIIALALVTAVFAASGVLIYDRFGSALLGRWAGAKSGKAAEETQIRALTDPSVASDENNNREVYNAVSPGVVNITSTVYVQDFFNVVPQQGSGSGSILDKEGRILTNFHVIQEARELDVTLANGKKYEAKPLGGDPDNDLAVIKIDAPAAELTPVQLGNSDELFVGQKVLAIGNPFGFDRTLTKGIISGLARPLKSEITGRLIEGAIQTDAAINHGNSGGPLLDSRGRLIGINTMIISPSGGSVGIGFAVPAKTAKKVIEDIRAYGRVRKPRMGIVEMVPLSRFGPRLIQALSLPVSEGLMVLRVVPGSGADKAGMRNAEVVETASGGYTISRADVITKVDGQVIAQQDDLDRALNSKNVGDRVQVEIVRNGRRMTLDIQLAELPQSGRQRT
ncbi:MAG TPA: trypsin-like peptidase domain-containing protein [Blastocatellia bacterium]|jgi:Trypsin-like serine proteases, typically periplasmic, contain C-terminal PDZ domain